MMAKYMIETREIRKSFRQNTASAGIFRNLIGRVPSQTVTALESLSFSVEEGQFYSLLGRNGAGKTTAIKILCTLLTPDGGGATVAGHDVLSDATEVRRNIGVSIRGERSVYWRLSGRQNLEYFGRLYDLSGAKLKSRAEEIGEIVGLADRLDDYVERYSMGMKQRLAIGAALIHSPGVLLLDEPTIGLDAAGARLLRRFISDELRERAKVTILYTTHYMHEAEEMSDIVGILHEGKIVAEGTPEQVSASTSASNVLEVGVRSWSGEITTQLEALPAVSGVSVTDLPDGKTNLRLATVDGDFPTTEIIAAITAGGAEVVSLQAVRPSLEDAFVALTGGEPEA